MSSKMPLLTDGIFGSRTGEFGLNLCLTVCSGRISKQETATHVMAPIKHFIPVRMLKIEWRLSQPANPSKA
jgi:hypothetical protein